MEKTKLISKESSRSRRRKGQINIYDGYIFNMSPIISEEAIQMMMSFPQSQTQHSDSFSMAQFLQKIRDDQQYIFPLADIENQSKQSQYNMVNLQKINSNYINNMELMADNDCQHHKRIVFEEYLVVKLFQKDDPPSKINGSKEYISLCDEFSRTSIYEKTINQNRPY